MIFGVVVRYPPSFNKNIDVAEDLVNDDPHIIIDYVAAILDTVITSLIAVDTRRYYTSSKYCSPFYYVQAEKIKVMAYPPYSPNLAPLDFWLSNYLKRDPATCSDGTSLAKILSKELNSLPIHEYPKTF
ncbi:unnamed protein product [Adineta steineri]|uniref:Transposase n=1 Tax=Adineta steineri TaxID=433720 RepID=A0A816FEX8_9BILA|nr:unnamed protein product [Adineta steineri]CAF1549518.1 unnamed protein product [Adineta steineri]CAF1660638.1 unnamed protein product [Adineta steineri]CAF1660652.1 unnamed protein product [Adineta steineri]